jgi:hypothetical protein
MKRVTVLVDGRQELSHLSWLYAGLGMLAANKELELRFRPLASKALPAGNVFAQVEVQSGSKTSQVLFDFKDQSNVFCDELRPDFYFKRSFVAAEAGNRAILPFGMPFACHYPGDLTAVARGLLESGLPWTTRLRRFQQYTRIADVRAFAASAPAAKARRVIFQTRLWEPHEVPGDDLDAVNQPRVSLIHRLRRELGSRFLGGLVPTARARRDHPDLVREDGVKRKAYLALMRGSAVGISTRGLFHSTPWKLSEYFSTGIAVVSQPIANTPLDPLIEGKHLLTFRSEDECLRQCILLLDNPDEAARMQVASRGYYESSIEPAAAVRRCLQRVTAP